MTPLKTLAALQEKATPGPYQTRFLHRVWDSARKDPINLFGTAPEQDWPDCEFFAACGSFDFTSLCDEMERMRKALEFYADPKTYEYTYVDTTCGCCGPIPTDSPAIDEDAGKIAREALGGKDDIRLHVDG